MQASAQQAVPPVMSLMSVMSVDGLQVSVLYVAVLWVSLLQVGVLQEGTLYISEIFYD